MLPVRICAGSEPLRSTNVQDWQILLDRKDPGGFVNLMAWVDMR